MEPDTSSKLIKLEKEDVNKGTYFASMQKCIGKHIGVIGGLVCGTVNASMEVAGKSMIGYYPPAELLFLRYAIHLPLNMAIILATKNSFKPCMSDIKYVLLISMTGPFSYFFLYHSFVNLSYFDSFAVAYGVMVISSIIVGRVWLKERISTYVLTIFVVVIFGIVMIAHPVFYMKTNDVAGHLYAAGSGIFMGIAGCSARKIKETPSTTSVLYLCLCILPVSIIAMILENDFKFPCNYSTVLVPLFIGCSSVTMHTVWNKCLKLSEVSKVMLAVQCDIPIGFILQWIFFNEIPTTLAILGGCCVVVGVMLTTLEDIIMRRLCGK
ncbi:Uncharacterised protein r2_g1474 [Pycnogonum litorale]